ncbi:MAG: hypothetical protein E6Q36_05270 [Chryseobacterium sp.]|nr:MAG: hypothetical protein E6Q36_05270 [Chryseobacterium sp.]
MTKEIDGNSMRYNDGKISFSSIPPTVLFGLMNLENPPYRGIIKLAEHYNLAEMKYPNAEAGNGHYINNWVKGQYIQRFIIDSMWRHLVAFKTGEMFDKDFGSHHLISFSWGCCAICHYFDNYILYKNFDDRPWVCFALNKNESNLTSLLLEIQVCDSAVDVSKLAFQLLVNSLTIYESCTDNDGISFNIDVERMNKIKNNEYGIPKKAVKK